MSSLATRAGTAADKASENPYDQGSPRELEAPASIDLPGVVPSGHTLRRAAGPKGRPP